MGDGMRLFDDQGVDLTETLHIRNVKINCGFGQLTTALLDVYVDTVEIKPGVIVVECDHPLTGQKTKLKKMVFEDGTLIDFDGMNQL